MLLRHAARKSRSRHRGREKRRGDEVLFGQRDSASSFVQTETMQPHNLLSSVLACPISSRLLAGQPIGALCSPHGRSRTPKNKVPVPCPTAGTHTHTSARHRAYSCFGRQGPLCHRPKTATSARRISHTRVRLQQNEQPISTEVCGSTALSCCQL